MPAADLFDAIPKVELQCSVAWLADDEPRRLRAACDAEIAKVVAA
jgi:hypothetical protein